MEERGASLAIVTETWLREDHMLCQDTLELRETAGLNILARCREALGNGVSYGGVAVVWRESDCVFRRVEIPNPGEKER